jgi:hypothetical protein
MLEQENEFTSITSALNLDFDSTQYTILMPINPNYSNQYITNYNVIKESTILQNNIHFGSFSE